MATTVERHRSATPVHLWIVGLLATLWNAFGCYDYVMTRMRNTDYIKSAMPGVDPNAALAWVDAMPIYAQIGWGLGVWGGLLGVVLLLMRSRYAVWAFAVSMVGIVLSLGYQIVVAPPLAGADTGINKIIPYVVIAIGFALLVYANAMLKKAVLR